MKISNNLKAGLFYGGIATLIIMAGKAVDYIVDTKLAVKEVEKEVKNVEVSEETETIEETVEETSADEASVETGEFVKGAAKVALVSAIVSVACIISGERGFKSGVIGGAYYFTRIGATNEQAGAIISDKTKFSEVLCLLRKAR